LDILGVYMPTTHTTDKETRATLYEEIAKITTLANDKQIGTHNVLVAGDFNATLSSLDRANGKTNPMGLFHREQIAKGMLYSLDPPTSTKPRSFIWRQGAAEQPASRIDDIFTNNNDLVIGATAKVWDMSGTDTDHNLVEVSIPYSNLNMRPPPPELDPAQGITN
jgi:endonuclease/exonuclease/phosphatase family metal-dependent hydrolase